MTKPHDIIVIGAALNGLAAALALGGSHVKRPLDVVVVDVKDPRAFSTNAFNGRVLLTGQVGSEADKQKATDVVKAISGVKGVDNQLTVGPITSLEVRNNDAFITSKVKSRLLGDNPELANAFKLVTENGVVYVLGNLTQSELERGIEITRTTSGVQRVVKTTLITIIQEPQAKALDQHAQEDAAKTQGTVTPLPNGDQQPTTQGIN